MDESKTENPETAFEPRDLDPRQLVKLGVGFIIMLGVVVTATTLLQFAWQGYAAPLAAQAPSLAPPPNVTLPAEPHPEAIPGAALAGMYARDLQQLTSYGWVNKSAGIVHIPIARAMELLVQRGLPVAPQDMQNDFSTIGNLAPSSSSSGRAMERVYP